MILPAKHLGFLSLFLCTWLQSQASSLINFGVDVPKNAVQHISMDPNGRWNFIFLTENQLHVTITSKEFVPYKTLDVEKLNQYHVHQLIGIHNTPKEILVFFTGSNEKNLKILSLHKFNEKVAVTVTNYEFQRNSEVLKAFGFGNAFHVLVKIPTSEDLNWLVIDEEKKTKTLSLQSEFPLASRWQKELRSHPQQNCLVNYGQRTTFRENVVVLKVYPREKQIHVTYDEPFKTHFFTLDLSSFSWKEKTYKVNFPDNVPISNNRTNSFLYEDELFQIMAGPWGFGLQKYQMLTDSCSPTMMYRTATPMSSELSKSYKDFLSAKDAEPISFSDGMNKIKGGSAGFGFSCRGSNTKLIFDLGFTTWNDKELLTTMSTPRPRQPSTKINGVKYDLISTANHEGQASYNGWTRTKGVYTCFAISNWDFEPIKYQGTGIDDFPKIRELETQMTGNFVMPSYNTVFLNGNLAFFGFYQKGKKLYHILQL